MFVPLCEDCQGGRSCEERRLEPKPSCLSAGRRTVGTNTIRLSLSLSVFLFLTLIPSSPRDSEVLVLSPALADRQVVSSSDRLLSAPVEAESVEVVNPVTWSEAEGEELNQGIRLKIKHPKVREPMLDHRYLTYKQSVPDDYLQQTNQSALISAGCPPSGVAR